MTVNCCSSLEYLLWPIFFFIGYGTLHPKTAGGQIFCVFFALFGIPLNIVFLHRVGKMLSLLCKKLGKFLYEKGMRKVIGLTYSGTIICSFLVFSQVLCCLILDCICFCAGLDVVLGQEKRHSSLAELSRHVRDIQTKACILSSHLDGRNPAPFSNQGWDGASHLIFWDTYLRSQHPREGHASL